MADKICEATWEGGKCDRFLSLYSHYCDAHYRHKRLGKPFAPIQFKSPPREPHQTPEEFRAWFYEQVELAQAPYPELQGDCMLWNRSLNGVGYGKVTKPGPRKQTQTCHTLSWEMYYGRERDSNLGISHLCNQRACVQPLHLAQESQKDNLAYAVKSGTRGRGARGELNEEQVRGIRAFVASGKTRKEAAAHFGVSYNMVKDLIRGKTYTWVD